jgi:hypothetical protein
MSKYRTQISNLLELPDALWLTDCQKNKLYFLSEANDKEPVFGALAVRNFQKFAL